MREGVSCSLTSSIAKIKIRAKVESRFIGLLLIASITLLTQAILCDAATSLKYWL
jgi:hypothetical protein